jgi:2-haloacid dehalogenase
VTHERGGRSVAIFDLGGVLLDCNPRHLYRKLFNGDDAAMEDFLANVCTTEWNERQDAGRTFAEGTRELLPRHADKVELIEAWGKRFDEMISGPIDGTVDVLSISGAKCSALWRLQLVRRNLPPQRARFPFLSWFRDIVVSGEVGFIKPDPRIFQVLLDRNGIAPESAVFIDDVAVNAAAASRLGIHGIHFRSPDQLRRDLAAVGLVTERP